jgi:putative inorganic carbon (hco3(-)) transporter
MSEVTLTPNLEDRRWQRFRDALPPRAAFWLIVLVAGLIPLLLLQLPMMWVIGGVVGLLGLALVIASPFFGLLLFLGLLYLRPEENFPELAGARMALIISSTACLAWMINACLCRERFRFHLPAVLCFFGFLTIAVGSTAISASDTLTETIMELLKLLILFVLIVHLVNTPSRLRVVLGALVLFTTILGIRTIGQYMNGEALVTSEGDVRALSTGIFGDPNDLALAMAMAVPLALGAILGQVSAWTRVWNMASVPILIWCIFVTNSRGGMLALATGVFLYFGKRLGRWGMIVGGLAVFLMFALGPSRMSQMSSDEESAQGRVEAWEAGMEMLKSQPIWGVGKGQFIENHWRTAHNSLVLCLGELGLAGTFLWLGLFYFAFRDTRRAAEELPLPPATGPPARPVARLKMACTSLTLQACLSAFAMGGFWLSRTYTVPLYVYLAMAIAASRVEWPSERGEMPGATGRDWLAIAGITVAGVILIHLLIRLWS